MTEVYGYSALHNAVIARDFKAVRTLTTTTEDGCDLETRDSMGFTALHLATLQGNKDLVEMLALAGCDINSRTKEGMTSLHISSERTGAEDILFVLASASCDVNARNKLGRTALHLAAKLGNPENLRTLLDAGCDRNIKDKLGFTAVGLAFKFNQKASADVLLHYKPKRNQSICKDTVPCETLSKVAAYETNRVNSEDVEVKPLDMTTSINSQELCAEKTLLKFADCVANRKALSLTIYQLILTILTQKRNIMDGLASSKSRKTLESVETVFERKLLNLILTSALFIQYPITSYTVTTPDDKPRKQCDSKPRAYERSNPLLSNLESSVLTKLLQGLKDTIHFYPSVPKCDRSVTPCLVWKPQQMEPALQDVKAFAQMLVKVCNGRNDIENSTSQKMRDNSILKTPCDITALQNRYKQKCIDIDNEAYEEGLKKLNQGLASLEDPGKVKEDRYESESTFVADSVESCLSSLDHVLKIESGPASFAEDVLDTFLQNSNIFIFCLNQKGSLFGTILNKVLSDEGPWLADKIAKTFLQVCVALASDQRLLLSCAGAVMRRGLSHQHSNAVVLGTCILVRMGLLKQEDKVDIVKDLKGPLLALGHLCIEEYFPRDLAAIFASFLCKSSPTLFGLDQLRLRALASAVTKEVLPISAQEAGSDVGKRFKRICDIVAVEGDCKRLINCVDALFSRVLVKLKCDFWRIGESILIYLGLLKSEFCIETVRNVSCALKVLHHAVKQSYFPSLLKQLLVCFLRKPNPALTPYSTEVEEILSSLTTASKFSKST